MSKDVFWCSPVPGVDDFGLPITNEFVDGRTKFGPWATMSPESWNQHGTGLGTGYGQLFMKLADGRWKKVAG